MSYRGQPFDKSPNAVVLTVRCKVVICTTSGNVRFRNFEPMDHGTWQVNTTFSSVPTNCFFAKVRKITVGTVRGRCREPTDRLLLVGSTLLFWISSNYCSPRPSEGLFGCASSTRGLYDPYRLLVTLVVSVSVALWKISYITLCSCLCLLAVICSFSRVVLFGPTFIDRLAWVCFYYSGRFSHST